MDKKNNGARRRKAFAEFKETQYEDSFSLDRTQKKRENYKKIFHTVLIILLTFIFIIIGFAFTDAMLNISEKPYHDNKKYTASYVEKTSAPSTVTSAGSSETEAVSQESESVFSQQYNQYYSNQSNQYYNNQVMGNY